MNTRIGLVLIAALVGVGPALTVGTGTAHAVNDCDFEFSPSTPTVLSPQITGEGVAACDVPPDRHIVTLALEWEHGGQWEVASVSQPDSTIPGPWGTGRHHYEVSAACYAGTWRIAVSIRGGIQGHEFHWDSQSGTVNIPTSVCHPRL